jgi:hypothetical protein
LKINHPVTRREAFKNILTSAGGIGAASFLPDAWMKPVARGAQLPAHASVSACVETWFGTLYDYVDHPEGAGFKLGVEVSPAPADGTPISYKITHLSNLTMTPFEVTSRSATISGGEAWFAGGYLADKIHVGQEYSLTITWTMLECNTSRSYANISFG